MSSAKFITIEGTEGVGKTTNIEFIKDYLEQRNIPLVVTREPGGTPLAEEIRQLLLHNRTEKVTDMTELLLMFAARSQHIQEVILPNLKQGRWVICDRFVDASYAYQGGGRGIEESKIAALDTLVLGDLQADMTLLLDLPVEQGLVRAAKRAELDRFEQEKAAFFERVRQAYLERAAAYPQRYKIIDVSGDLLGIQQRLSEILDELLN